MVTITIKKVNKTSEYDNSFVRSTWLIDIKERTQNLNQHLKINSEFTVLDHGHANYKFNSDSKISYYFLLKDSVGKVTDLWAKELENFVKFYNIKKGDKVIIDKNQSLKKASNKQKISL
ncbi:hypothetical protein V757_11035 [Pelistega indica]|uniref:Uncharacterized protein n=1 Tax=Pelistega indica TaxID=1414851 RepID=V8FUV4_9BURK|nr:hypothetical protein [Pelistega indica]ETD67666.1 hypothetical protein V757_11035 [Pelistega indica]